MWKYLRYGVLGLGIALIATAVFFDSEPELTFAAGGDVTFNDTFTDTSGTDLDAHTPTTGDSWTQQYQSGGSACSNDPVADISGTNTLIPGCDDETTSGVSYTADVTYPSADYQVQYTCTDCGESDNYAYSSLRGNSDLTSAYVLWDTGQISTEDPTISLTTASDACTTLDAVDQTDTATTLGADGVVIVFQVHGNELIGFFDNLGYVYATNTVISAANKGGIGMGALPCDTIGDMPVADIEIDDFSVLELAGSSDGYNPPSTTGEITNQFTSPTNAYTHNLSRATETAVGEAQDYGDFGLSVAAGSTIRGIQVRVIGDAQSSTRWAEVGMEVSNDNGSTWSSQLLIRVENDGVDDTFVFGHANYLWGLTWGDGDLDDTDFRVRIELNAEEAASANLQIDAIAAKVFYDAGGGGDGDGDGDVQDVIWFD